MELRYEILGVSQAIWCRHPAYCVEREARGLTLEETRAELRRAFNEYEQVDGVEVSPFRFVEADCATAAIHVRSAIEGAGSRLVCPASADASFALAHANIPSSPSPSIVFNDCVRWTTGSGGRGPAQDGDPAGGNYSLWRVAVHEIGHIVGLDHSGVKGTVMTPDINTAWSHLTEDDRRGLAAVVQLCVECPDAGLTRCGLTCHDLRTDAAHCGACGAQCRADQVCVAGHCQCAGGSADCAGQCVSTASDPRHCGACGAACASPRLCAAGTCGCAEGLTQCGGRCVGVGRDPAHCLGCDRPCAAGELCDHGACMLVCAPGQTNCGGRCVDLQGEVGACGACTRSCPAGPQSAATCVAGACGLRCDEGWRDADRNPSNGCECHPMPAELCNGRDDTCDGMIDEGCPRGVELRAPTASVTYGGSGGGPFTLGCPDGWAAAGIFGRSGDWLDNLAVECRRVSLSAPGAGQPAYTVQFPSARCDDMHVILRDVPQHNWCLLRGAGGGGGAPFSFTCPSDAAISEVEVGYGSRFTTSVDSLRVRCARFQVLGAPGAWSIRALPAAESPVFGMTRGTQTTIPAAVPGVVTGFLGRSGASVDALGVTSSGLALQF